MNNLIVKVDRVNKVEEAVKLQKLGADFIGISFLRDQRFQDNRSIDLETAQKIQDELNTSKLVGEFELNNNFLTISQILEEINLDYIQLYGNQIPSPEVLNEIESRNLKLIFSGINASYDDDPSWIMSKYDDILYSNPLFQLDLLGDVENSWSFLKNEAPKYEGELQIPDISTLASTYPILITTDFQPYNIMEIINEIPSIKGISMPLGDAPFRNDIHYFGIDEVHEVLSKLKHL